MFKIVRRRQEHTGGGDGDDDGTDLEGEGDGGKDGAKKRKISKRVRFSKSVLDAFEKSVFFRALDEVCVFPFNLSSDPKSLLAWFYY